MATVHGSQCVPLKGIVQGDQHTGSLDIDPENIPYHARENALPFTYGNVPVGFNTSDLNHVLEKESLQIEECKLGQSAAVYPTTPITTRKTTRPSISASCPLLRKTPSRQEFEDMLMERKLQTAKAKKELPNKLVKNETIVKDMEEHHQRLTTALDAEKERGRCVESIDLPDAELCSLNKNNNFELELVEKRSETPSFPFLSKQNNSERCVSPYPAPSSSNALIFEENSDTQKAKRGVQKFDGISHTKEVEPHLVKFAKDLSEFWYKPNISRDEAVDLLRNAEPGTFLIRNSTTYRDAFGLVLRVAKAPPGVVTGPGYGDQLVRHFLLEPTTRGVHLMGCTNEPIFTSLSAFVYEHSINPMALPCTLKIPHQDILIISNNQEFISTKKLVLAQGAACNVLYLFKSDMESLTGDDAVRKAVFEMYSDQKRPVPLEVHFKISGQGITLTDNTRKKFFRRHYPAKNISHFCMDPNSHLWSVSASDEGLERTVNKSIFAFIARPLTGSKDNECHIFCDLSSLQPASVIVSFAHKVLPLHNSGCKML